MQFTIPRLTALLVLVIGHQACQSSSGEPGAGPAVLGADPGGERALLLHGGPIYRGRVEPGGAAVAPVEALLAVDGKVLDLGALTELEARWNLEAAERIDLEGATAMPGLQDAHGHVAGYGALLEQVDLAGSQTYEEAIERIVQHAAGMPLGAWVTGRGWDHTMWPGAEFPEHGPLSAAVPGHPVFVRRVDGHAALANQAALEAAGLFDVVVEQPVIEGGRIHVGADGKPTGLFIDTAMAMVDAVVPPEEDEGAISRAILAAQDELLTMGLVCVHDMGITREVLGVYEELRDSGELRLRICAYLWGNQFESAEDLEGLPLEPDPVGRLQAKGVKLMADGALGSRGAALLAPYTDAPSEQGLMRFDRRELLRLVRLCARAGMQPATHAIGDAANRMVLDVYEQVITEQPEFSALRPRIEHAQVVALSDLTRLGALGVIPSVQPTHCTSDMRWAEDRLGPERVLGAYAWRSLEAPLAPLALGSDFPVESPDPLLGLYAAVTRQDASGHPSEGWYPAQRIEPAAAAEGFAWNAAFAVSQDRTHGRLEPGYACDVSVFDTDVVQPGDPAEILGAKCLLTVIDGVVEYDAR